MHILIVEDEPEVVKTLTKLLHQKDFKTTSVDNGEDALRLVKNKSFDVVLLDIMLPKISGTEVLKSIRESNNNIPIILLTAIGSNKTIVDSLNNGADDYLVKPFEINELDARIKAVLRRSKNTQTDSYSQEDILQYKSLKLNNATKKVHVNDEEISLTGKEFNLLKFFLENQGKVLSREAILEEVWGINFQIGTNVVDVYINYLRKKIAAKNTDKLIETVIGMGYVIR